jgi:hypothetical protein
MCLAFLPVGFAIMSIHAIPAAPRLVLTIIVAGGLWWGPLRTPCT